MKHDDRFNELHSLDKYQLENESQDIRGWQVHSPTNEVYGKVEDMLVDKDRKEVLAVRLDDGRMVSTDKLELKDGHAVYHDAGAASTHSYTKVRDRH
ncbi:MAG: PRC-barrel domain-containing protein [Erythrobacter sp.]|uniref:PRC-barrel domain-containing protein n=1 Tax=Erythrobacter sp. TaxID=1042 RepID=UPI003C7204B9